MFCTCTQEPLFVMFKIFQYTYMNNSLFVGIDVSRDSNTEAIHSSRGILIETIFTLPNNQIGVETLIQKLCHFLSTTPEIQLLTGCETTCIYNFHLLKANELSSFNVLLYHLHPKLAHHFRKFQTFSQLRSR